MGYYAYYRRNSQLKVSFYNVIMMSSVKTKLKIKLKYYRKNVCLYFLGPNLPGSYSFSFKSEKVNKTPSVMLRREVK